MRGEKIAWNTKKLNQAIYNYIYRLVHDLKGEWVFFQNDFLNIFNEILSSQLVIIKKEHAPFIALIKGVLRKFFSQLQKNPLLVVESMFRFSDILTKDKILNDYDIAMPVVEIDQEGDEKLIEKTVLPWMKEEDLILLENWGFFKDQKDPFTGLSSILHDQSYFREPKEVRFRVRLLKIDKSKDAATKIIDEAHSHKESVEEIVVRFLLYTHLKGRKIESAFFSFMDEVCESFEDYVSCFTTSAISFPVVPVTPAHFDLLSHTFVPSIFTFIGSGMPQTGQIYYRIPTNVDMREKMGILKRVYNELKDTEERQLLDMGDTYQQGKARRERAAEGKEKNGAKGGKREKKKESKDREREEIMKINRELAGLADSDDEDLDLDEIGSDDEAEEKRTQRGKVGEASDDEGVEVVRRKPVNGSSKGEAGVKSIVKDVNEQIDKDARDELGGANGRETGGRLRKPKRGEKRAMDEESIPAKSNGTSSPFALED